MSIGSGNMFSKRLQRVKNPHNKCHLRLPKAYHVLTVYRSIKIGLFSTEMGQFESTSRYFNPGLDPMFDPIMIRISFEDWWNLICFFGKKVFIDVDVGGDHVGVGVQLIELESDRLVPKTHIFHTDRKWPRGPIEFLLGPRKWP